jgi:hypothetical protein
MVNTTTNGFLLYQLEKNKNNKIMKILIILLSFLLTDIKQSVDNQVVKIHVKQGDIIYDSGGKDGNYLNCSLPNDMCTSITTICSTAPINLIFTKFKLFNSVNNGDRLQLLDNNVVIFDSNKESPGVYSSSDTCLTFKFTSTSIGTDIGWEALVNVLDPIDDSPPPIEDVPCNYICKANVIAAEIPTYRDLVMNPTNNCNYNVMLLDKGNIITNPVKGKRYEYKVGDETNHCWGYIIIQ